MLTLSAEIRPGEQLVLHASELVRARPWHGVGLAFVVGVALGLAPREALRRVSLVVPIATRLLAGIDGASRAVGAAGRPTRTPTGTRRPY